VKPLIPDAPRALDNKPPDKTPVVRLADETIEDLKAQVAWLRTRLRDTHTPYCSVYYRTALCTCGTNQTLHAAKTERDALKAELAQTDEALSAAHDRYNLQSVTVGQLTEQLDAERALADRLAAQVKRVMHMDEAHEYVVCEDKCECELSAALAAHAEARK
jgi:hypothetical protein